MIICLIGVYNKIASGQSWEAVPNLPLYGSVDLIKVHSMRSDFLFIGVKGNLYASYNRGKDWKHLIRLGSTAQIYDLYLGDKHMFLLTSDGLFRSDHRGFRWRRLFHGASRRERDVFAISQSPKNTDHLYLGTRGGLFESYDAGKNWQKVTGELASQAIQDMKLDGENNELFIVSDRGLYRSVPAKNQIDWVYVTRASVSSEEEEFSDELEGLDEQSFDENEIHGVVIAEHPVSTVAIATAFGVFVSEDEGNSWDQLPTSGLTNTNIADLEYSMRRGTFIAATDKGVFAYDAGSKHWKRLDGVPPSVRVRHIALAPGEPEYLYAAGEDGLYRMPIQIGVFDPEIPPLISAEKWNLLSALFQREPTAQMVQKQAIRYANVGNWKIRRWKWGSRLRALVPRLSVGKSFSVSDSISVDHGGTQDPDVFIVGPTDKSKNWDLDLNWDLSDLIWNSSRTSIDLREQQMVELRDELLSRLTHLYFERRRSQAELVLRPPTDPLDRWNGLLRIDELTASIDAMTDGYLTNELNKIYAEHPEFYSLWE